MNESFARPEVTRGGGFWIETPQTASATVMLLKAFAVSRMDDPGWQPIWILCGPPGAGLTALATRIAARAQSIATGQPEWRPFADTSEAPTDTWPAIVREGEAIWDQYRTALDKADNPASFGVGPFPNLSDRYASRPGTSEIHGANDAEPVIVARMDHATRRGRGMHGLDHSAWGNQANQTRDDPRRTSLAFVHDVDHLVRLSEAKRMRALEEMLEWPDVIGFRHRVMVVLLGSSALADAVATCKPVRRIELLPMELDGPEGTFAKVLDLVFGENGCGRLSELHGLSDGLIGRLLNIAHLEGLRAPYGWANRGRLRLPSTGTA